MGTEGLETEEVEGLAVVTGIAGGRTAGMFRVAKEIEVTGMFEFAGKFEVAAMMFAVTVVGEMFVVTSTPMKRWCLVKM